MNLVRIIELEIDVLDNERPNVVAETVGIEVALREHMSVCGAIALKLQLSFHQATADPP